MGILLLVAVVAVALVAAAAIRLVAIRRRRERAPEWWPVFEREFWDFVERGELPRRRQGHMG